MNSLSAYRTLYDDAAGLKAKRLHDAAAADRGLRGTDRIPGLPLSRVQSVAATVSRPRRRSPWKTIEHGTTAVQPRAIERVAELAACGNPDVTAASGRLGDDELSVGIDSRRASAIAATLRDVHRARRTPNSSATTYPACRST